MKISHDHADESPEAMARKFQSLTWERRSDLFVSYTNLILSNNPDIIRQKRNARPARGSFQVLSLPDSDFEELTEFKGSRT